MQAKPIKRLLPAYQRCLCWLTTALLYLGVGVALIGLRSDFGEKWLEFSFILQAVLALLVAILSAFGALGTQMICRNDDLLHVILWHVIPVLVMGALGAVLGQLFLRWERR